MMNLPRSSKRVGGIAAVLSITLMAEVLCCSQNARMADLLREWRVADGERVFIMEEKLFDRLLKDPSTFYEAMLGDSASFDRFVGSLQSGVFTNYDGTSVEALEQKRTAAIKRLEAATVIPQHSRLHIRVLDRLRDLQVRDTD